MYDLINSRIVENIWKNKLWNNYQMENPPL